MKHVVSRTRPLVAVFALAVGWSAVAAEFTWTGAAGDQIVTNRLNWVDAEGVQAENAPTYEDTLIFDITNGMIVTNFSNRADYEYRKVILRGTGNLTFYGWGDCPTDKTKRLVNGKIDDYDFGLPLEVVNETTNKRLLFGGQDPHVARGVSAVAPATNFVTVAQAEAIVENSNHLQPFNNHHRVVKRGAGIYIPFGGHNYDTRNFTVQEGTVKFKTHASRNWYNCSLVFLGDAAGKTFHFIRKDGSVYNNLPASYWAQYIFQVPLVEEDVTTTDHTLYGESAPDLVYTNSVTDMSFTGRMRGNLNFHWAPTDVTQTFTYSKGESDTTGSLNVTRGKMLMREGAKFTALTRLTVGTEGELDLAEGTAIRTATACVGGVELPVGIYSTFGAEGTGRVTGGGLLLVGTDGNLNVPYTDATKTAATLDFTESTVSASAFSQLAPISVTLSEQIDVRNDAMHETNRLAVARFAAALGVTGEMFTDTTPKTHGLPTTWFETETEDGVTTLYLMAKPVISVVLYKGTTDAVKYYYTQDPNMWSDGKLPHAGADYYNWFKATNKDSIYFYETSSTAPCTFGGDSLTAGYSLFYFNSTAFTADLRFYDCRDENSNVILPSRAATVAGKIYAESTCNPLTLRPASSTTGAPGAVFTIAADISGPAFVRCKYAWSTSKLAEMALHGDNRGLTGRLEIRSNVCNESAEKQYWQQLEVAITNANALGGAMATPDVLGVRFTCFPLLKVNDTTTYCVTNRNWASDNGLRLFVAEGKTFTLKNPYGCLIQQSNNFNQFVPQRCAVEKTGEGTFVMGAPILPLNSSFLESSPDGTNNLVRILEGGIGPLAADAFDRCRMEFADGTAIVAVPTNAATAAYGLRLLDEAPVFAEGARVRLLPDMTGCEAGSSLTVTFLTVPATTPDLTSSLRPAAFSFNGRRWLGRQITKDVVSIDGREYTRYSARFSMSGFVINLR